MKIIEKPFLAAPPGSGGGKLAKADSTAISDAELQKLKDAKMKHGDVEIVWSRPTSMSSAPHAAIRLNKSEFSVYACETSTPVLTIQPNRCKTSGPPVPPSRALSLPKPRARPNTPKNKKRPSRAVIAGTTGTAGIGMAAAVAAEAVVAVAVVVDVVAAAVETGVATEAEGVDSGTSRTVGVMLRPAACRLL